LKIKVVLSSLLLILIISFRTEGGEHLRKFRPKENISWQKSLQRLKAGNKRYLSMLGLSDKKASLYSRKYLTKGQWPFATILCCSDSRVSPEIIFDSGQGELFIVRVAGNVIDPDLIGSIEYATLHSTSHLIIVMGHEFCGAVTATVDHMENPKVNDTPDINSIISKLMLPVIKAQKKTGLSGKKLIDAAARENVRMVTKDVLKNSAALRKLEKQGKIKVVSAYYLLSTGKVEFLNKKRDI